MNDSTLFKIALVVSIIGVFITLIIAEKVDLSNSNIANLTNYKLGDKVKVKGIVTNTVETEKVLILDVKDDTGKVTVIAYRENNMTIKEGSLIEVKGTLTEYKDKLEVEADLIKLY